MEISISIGLTCEREAGGICEGLREQGEPRLPTEASMLAYIDDALNRIKNIRIKVRCLLFDAGSSLWPIRLGFTRMVAADAKNRVVCT